MTPTSSSRRRAGRLDFRKSSLSGASNACVEVARTPTGVALRDSKHPDGPVLHFGHDEWGAFLHDARAGRFDLGR